MFGESRSRNETRAPDEQAANVADPPLEAPRVQGSQDEDVKSNAVSQTTQDELSRIARILILVPVILTYFLWFLDLAVISTATPAITSEFNSLVDVGWYGGAYQLGSSAFTPLTGKLFRSFSIKASSSRTFMLREAESAARILT
ncbi:hypothetical protein LTR35_000186 [Friedmanniomyces endolithicus]|uniref:Major facilitator superfamily (MFS) profile domain-containing protein n=1 Tax=Friedmanniomyces endolithicus TaxID=329885 RepID=A0AAN6F5G5_9PEZI|nr:hypothetical protein LTS00_016676 [Friedmanniomyces endolithicus]KAK0293582.1 hypothetical protein LTR35_000186 [Friedmanniomyces endolithicus]KAK0304857.1 hypothetical protein LTR82_017049 [Friedmanniomyces endolithicus]KAK0975446.1 hypothetical protein LTR54_016774 [Friedmanniomyces endolithicus]